GGKEGKPPADTTAAGQTGAARVQSRGCKGRSPLHKITLKSPLPAGKGVGGMGAENQAKGKVGRRQRKHAPRRVQRRQSRAGNKKPPAREKISAIPLDKRKKRGIIKALTVKQ
ncbi:MAG: hypothetical protein EGR02_08700, partial [Clostridiales bacterium]|nr:hypothetical protein [Clostridiales bacterium]